MRRSAAGILLPLLLLLALSGCGQTALPANEPSRAQTADTQENGVTGRIRTGDGEDFSSDAGENSWITREISVPNGDQKIYGIAYLPGDGRKTYPLIVFAHELGENHETGIPYAEHLVQDGYAVYVFDFCGGSANGTENQSTGDSTQMSVLTEVRDLEHVLDAAKTWDFTDPSRISILGASQGGFVSAITAARHPDEVRSLMLLYPAFSIYHDMHARFSSLSEVPDTFGQWGNWITLGRIYVEDIWDLDPYETIGDYDRPVLLLHGDADGLVDSSWSERARDTYSHAEFHLIENGSHGFYGQPFAEAVGDIEDFLARHMPAA